MHLSKIGKYNNAPSLSHTQSHIHTHTHLKRRESGIGQDDALQFHAYVSKNKGIQVILLAAYYASHLLDVRYWHTYEIVWGAAHTCISMGVT